MHFFIFAYKRKLKYDHYEVALLEQKYLKWKRKNAELHSMRNSFLCTPLDHFQLTFCLQSPVHCNIVKYKQGDYSLRRPPKLIIPKIFTKQRWATVYRFMCNCICKSKQAYMTRAKVMSSLRDKINQKLLTFKRTPSP